MLTVMKCRIVVEKILVRKQAVSLYFSSVVSRTALEENFDIAPFNPITDTEDFVNCIALQFSQGEPACSTLGIKKQELDSVVRHFLTCSPETAELSVVMRERKTNKFVGCVGGEDLHANSEPGIIALCPKWALLCGPYNFIGSNLIDDCKRGEMVHWVLGGIYDEFANRKLYLPMVKYALTLAADKGIFIFLLQVSSYSNFDHYLIGYKYVIAEPTHIASKKCLEKLNFEMKSDTPFDTYVWNGTRPFKGNKTSLFVYCLVITDYVLYII
jgi:hypothetical protein